MGVMQFIFLVTIVMVYVLLFGGLIARLIKRNISNIKSHSAPAHDEIPAEGF